MVLMHTLFQLYILVNRIQMYMFYVSFERFLLELIGYISVYSFLIFVAWNGLLSAEVPLSNTIPLLNFIQNYVYITTLCWIASLDHGLRRTTLVAYIKEGGALDMPVLLRNYPGSNPGLTILLLLLLSPWKSLCQPTFVQQKKTRIFVNLKVCA